MGQSEQIACHQNSTRVKRGAVPLLCHLRYILHAMHEQAGALPLLRQSLRKWTKCISMRNVPNLGMRGGRGVAPFPLQIQLPDARPDGTSCTPGGEQSITTHLSTLRDAWTMRPPTLCATWVCPK